MTQLATAIEFPSELASWVRQSTGVDVTGAERALSGGSRTTWLLETNGAGSLAELVLRLESGTGAFADTELKLEREAVLYRALSSTSIPIPRLIAVADDGQKLLVTRAPGRADLRRESAEIRRSALVKYVAELVQLHQLDISALPLPGYVRPLDARAHAVNEVCFWERLARSHGEPDIELEFAFAWLHANPPERIAGTSLLHGDCGPGNFIYDGGEITALIDWELAHIGDPTDDLAWLEHRVLQAGESPQLAQDLIDHYMRASGRYIDAEGLQYYRCLVLVRCAVTAARSIATGGPLGRAAYRRAHRRFLRDALLKLVQITGAPLEHLDLPETDADNVSDCFDEAIEHAAALVASTRGAAKLRAIWLEWTVRFLRNSQRFGREISAANHRDAELAFGGASSGSSSLAALASAAGEVSDVGVLAALTRRAIRNDWLWTGEAVPS
jgi:aminoglycoside phosphotransferase (APT) family kinase protein